MTTEEIRSELFRLRDEKYKAFQGALLPTVRAEDMIGVRTPSLRALAKKLARNGDGDAFLAELPHRYFEENQLHAFLLSESKDFDRCIFEVDHFLPYVDNWATCDQMSPRIFRRRKRELLPYVERWLASPEEYVVRFGIKMLMDHFLEEDFDPRYPAWVAAICREEYYIEMMASWYFATALAKRYDEVLPYVTEPRLSPAVRKKAIRKALESYRIPEERKTALRMLRRMKEER